MTLLHPSLRMPAWVAVAIVAAAFVVRAALNAWDFRLQLPGDAIIVLALVAILGLRAFLRRRGWDSPEPDEDARAEQASRSDDGDDAHGTTP
jgi:membrane protein implicated in regulation of membrane protease activity